MEEESEEFPFNMSDFVTVDEVGDVTDLPRSPSPTVPMETAEEDAPPSVQSDTEAVQYFINHKSFSTWLLRWLRLRFQ